MEQITATLSSNICLAVLPLQILSDDPRLDAFCQGLVMDLTTSLSRFRSFQVIAQEAVKGLSSTEAPGSPLLRELEVDYLAGGMVRLRGDSLHFNLRLVNVKENRLVWAEKFSSGFNELLHLQEEVEEKIVAALQQFIDHDLLREGRRKPLTNLSAYECWLSGYQELKKGTLAADESARVFFRQAMALDPYFSRAYTGMSLSYFNEWSCQLWSRWEVSQSGARKWALKALELDAWDHVSNAILGRIYLFNGEYEKAEYYLEQSLRINANDPETLLLLAVGFTYLGQLPKAMLLYKRAKRLNPNQDYAACGAFIHFEAGDFETAIALSEQPEAENSWVDFSAYRAAAHFPAGDLPGMRRHWQAYLDEFSRKINGGETADMPAALRWMMEVNPYREDTKLTPFWEYIGKEEPIAIAPSKRIELPRTRNSFQADGEVWTLCYNGHKTQLTRLKGLQDLARLLDQPHTAIHCTQLMSAKLLEKGEVVFDEKAKAAYRSRILQLQEAMQEAEAAFHTERLVELQEEYDQLVGHLSRSLGRGGKARKLAGTVEKCRTAVTWRIRSAIKKIAEQHPALGRHLEVSIQTGVFCTYTPEHEMVWEVIEN